MGMHNERHYLKNWFNMHKAINYFVMRHKIMTAHCQIATIRTTDKWHSTVPIVSVKCLTWKVLLSCVRDTTTAEGITQHKWPTNHTWWFFSFVCWILQSKSEFNSDIDGMVYVSKCCYVVMLFLEAIFNITKCAAFNLCLNNVSTKHNHWMA